MFLLAAAADPGLVRLATGCHFDERLKSYNSFCDPVWRKVEWADRRITAINIRGVEAWPTGGASASFITYHHGDHLMPENVKSMGFDCRGVYAFDPFAPRARFPYPHGGILTTVERVICPIAKAKVEAAMRAQGFRD